MGGSIDEGRALHDTADDIMEDLGMPPMSAALTCFTRTVLELLAGAPVRAEQAARAGLQAFEAMGNRNQGSTAAALVGLTLIEQGRDDEALEFADLAAAWAAPDDTASQVLQLTVRARVLAGRGEHAAAQAAATHAVASIESVRRPIDTRRCARRLGPRAGAGGTHRGRCQVATRSRCTLRTQGQRHLRRPRPRDDRAPRTPRGRHRRLGVLVTPPKHGQHAKAPSRQTSARCCQAT